MLIAFAEASALGEVGSVTSLGTGRLPVDVRRRDPNPWVWTLAQDLVEGSLEASANIQEGVSDSIFEYLAIPFLRLDGNVKHDAMEDASKLASWVAAADEILNDKATMATVSTFCLEHLWALDSTAPASRLPLSPQPLTRPAAKLPALPSDEPPAPTPTADAPRHRRGSDAFAVVAGNALLLDSPPRRRAGASPPPGAKSKSKRTPRRQAMVWACSSDDDADENAEPAPPDAHPLTYPLST